MKIKFLYFFREVLKWTKNLFGFILLVLFILCFYLIYVMSIMFMAPYFFIRNYMKNGTIFASNSRHIKWRHYMDAIISVVLFYLLIIFIFLYILGFF